MSITAKPENASFQASRVHCIYLEFLDCGAVLVEMQLLGHGGDPGVAASSGENDAIGLTARAREGEGGDGGGGGELV